MQIKKAVIAAGGWSTRFLPTVKAYAKHLVPVLDKPQIQLVLEELVGAGIDQITIVHRHGEKTIRDYFKPNPELNDYLAKTGKQDCLASLNNLLKKIKVLKFIPQSRSLPYGNGTPVICAKSFIDNDPFVYLWGDDLTIEDNPGDLIKHLISTFDKYHPDSILAVQKMTPLGVSRCAAPTYTKNPSIPFQIDSIIEKPLIDNLPSLYGQTSRYILTPKMIDVLKQEQIDRGELWLTNAENSLAKIGTVLAIPHPKNIFYATTGDPLRWLKTNIRLSLKHPKFKNDIKTYLKTLKL